MVESSSASAVLDAVESSSVGSAASVSHVVFESGGRAVGALMPALGEDGQQGKQQVVLTGQQGDQQVVLAVDGDVLGTAAGGDSRNILLQVRRPMFFLFSNIWIRSCKGFLRGAAVIFYGYYYVGVCFKFEVWAV